MRQTITIPNNWRPRAYQLPAWRALEAGIGRLILIWHRRAGKDDFCLHWAACAAMQRVGTYWHMLPQANQARKAIWDAVNPNTGKRRIDEAFPLEIRELTRENEMFIRFRNGSTWQVVGSDGFSGLLGSPPIGITYSEYAMADPNAWSYLRPILAENGGWAVFITTPRGRNHAARMYEGAIGDPNWFGQRLTVEDTGAITPGMILRERNELARERGEKEAQAIIDQEYYCSFDAALPGAYYGELIARADKEGRLCELPYDGRYPVVTGWDLGFGDSTAIVFAQEVGPWIHVIDYVEASGAGADFYAKEIHARDFVYQEHLLPHDAEVHEWGANGTTRTQALYNLKVKPLRLLPRTGIDDRINAGRMMLRRTKFDRVKCLRLTDALRSYQKVWNEKTMMFSETPLHDWTSHGADGYGYFAQGFRSAIRIPPPDTWRNRLGRGRRGGTSPQSA